MIDSRRLTADGRLRTRPAEAGDAAFARDLYLATSRAHLAPAASWDEGWTEARFRIVYKRRESWVLCVGPEAVGWLQIGETLRQVVLHQIHLLPAYRDRGLGSRLVQELQAQAGAARKSIVLSVLRPNPAVEFYRRLGFVVTGEDDRVFRMRWGPEARSLPARPDLASRSDPRLGRPAAERSGRRSGAAPSGRRS